MLTVSQASSLWEKTVRPRDISSSGWFPERQVGGRKEDKAD